MVRSPRQALRGSASSLQPCGYCSGCRRSRVRELATRAVHEASCYRDNCFLTLTYSPENLPPHGALDYSHPVSFMKRLREKVSRDFSREIRAFGCAEYGSLWWRPHYHLLIFNFDFPDKVVHAQNPQGDSVFTSSMLSDLWPLGFSTIGSVSFSSAAYVAAYVTKKWHGKDQAEKYTFPDEETGELFTLPVEKAICFPRGKKGGLGRPWFDKFGSDVFPHDNVVVEGKRLGTPRFYDKVFERNHPADFLAIKEQRLFRGTELKTPERLRIEEKCFNAKLSVLKRRFEDDF